MILDHTSPLRRMIKYGSRCCVLLIAPMGPREAVAQEFVGSSNCRLGAPQAAPGYALVALRGGVPRLARYDDERSARMAASECEPEDSGNASPSKRSSPRTHGSIAEPARAKGIVTNRAEWSREHDAGRSFGVRDEDARTLERTHRREDAEDWAYERRLMREANRSACPAWRESCSVRQPRDRGSRFGISVYPPDRTFSADGVGLRWPPKKWPNQGSTDERCTHRESLCSPR